MSESLFEVRYTPEGSDPRAVVFEPHDDSWRRTEFEWTGDEWRQIGSEPVTQVALFGGECALATSLDLPSNQP